MSNRQSSNMHDSSPLEPSWAGRSVGSDDQRADQWNDLEPALEKEIIPRLMMAFQQPHGELRNAPSASSPAGDLPEMVDIVLNHDVISAVNYIQGLRNGGASLQSLYLSLITDTARKLGDMWAEDECSFFDVTVGVSRLQQVMLEFSHCFCSQYRQREPAENTALIVPMPGEQHSFGQFMVVEFFRRAGWNVHASAPRSIDTLELLVSQQHFDLVGLSVSGDRFVDQLSPTIDRLREASFNSELKVLIGGRSVAVRDSLVDEVGADATAGDGSAAVAAADRLVNV